MEYSKRLGSISNEQFQKALDKFSLGRFVEAEPVPFGNFGQNVFITSTKGKFVLRGKPHYKWQFKSEQIVANGRNCQRRRSSDAGGNRKRIVGGVAERN